MVVVKACAAGENVHALRFERFEIFDGRALRAGDESAAIIEEDRFRQRVLLRQRENEGLEQRLAERFLALAHVVFGNGDYDVFLPLLERRAYDGFVGHVLLGAGGVDRDGKLHFALLFGASGAVIGGIIAFDLVPDSKKYMLNRFIVLFDHNYDVQGQGWQQTRSLLTIGGGGFWGQGYLHGTQSQAGVGSVPARHTDLIFAVIGEELGFVGATLAILLLVAIIIRVLVVGRRAAQPFHTYVCVGIASMVMFQMIINIGMCLFIMPVIGLTLPFFSYGGSSVVTLFAAMGFVSGIKKRTVVRRRPGRPLGSNAVY